MLEKLYCTHCKEEPILFYAYSTGVPSKKVIIFQIVLV